MIRFTCSFAQNDSISFLSPSKEYNSKRVAKVLVAEGVLYAGSLIALNALWYKNYSSSKFHFFNDNAEWLQMDKAGHLMTSYQIGRIGINLMKWSGVERKKAIWYGGALGSVYQTTIELLDGFSSKWGFSSGDFTANTMGSLMLIGEELLWNEQRITLKFSYHQSRYPFYRPNLLGNKWTENILKDYNGQTYWLSANLNSFLNKENKFPKWLNISIGYGAEGMTGANLNPSYIDQDGNKIMFERYRKYYLSFDADLTRIKTKSKFLKTCFTVFSCIKIPAPSLELNKNGLKFRSLYY